jgi:hypothetical protein
LRDIRNGIPEDYTALCAKIIGLDGGHGICSDDDGATINGRVECSIYRLR